MIKAYLFLVMLLALMVFTATASAAIFTVTKTADTVDGVCDSDCSLREAVGRANAVSSDDIIVFSPSLNGATVDLNYMLGIGGGGNLVIQGLGADRLTISGHGTEMIEASGPMNLRFADFKITGAVGAYPTAFLGGAISSDRANVEIDRVYFTGNVMEGAVGMGAALYLNGGINRVSNSTFSGNTSSVCGAAVIAGTTTIVNTTFFGNTANSGGAICFVSATAKMRNVTITGNSAGFGGAMQLYTNSVVNIGNSVIAGNLATQSFPELRREGNCTMISAGNNHIGDSLGDSTDTGAPVTWAGSDRLDAPPVLGALQNNGGRTPTILPLTGSPLINGGSNTLAEEEGLVIDQRGYIRTIGGTVDQGAVEAESAPASINISGKARHQTGQIGQTGRAIPGTFITLTDMLGNRRGMFTTSGYYFFPNVPAGESYFVSASQRRFSFLPVLVNADRNIVDIFLNSQE